jgi:hypothetical protein
LNVAGSIPDVIEFFILISPSRNNKVLGLTQRLTEMSTRKSFWGGAVKAWLERKAENLTAVYVPVV